MAPVGTHTRQSHAGSFDDPGELSVRCRKIRRHHNHNGSLIQCRRCDLLQDPASHRLPVNPQIFCRSKIALHQHAQCIALRPYLKDPGSRSDSAFESKAGRPFARSHVAFLKVRFGAFNRAHDLRNPNHALRNPVQRSIVALPYDRIDRTQLHTVFLCLPNHILHQRVMHPTYIERIGQRDRRLQCPKLLNLYQSLALPVAV